MHWRDSQLTRLPLVCLLQNFSDVGECEVIGAKAWLLFIGLIFVLWLIQPTRGACHGWSQLIKFFRELNKAAVHIESEFLFQFIYEVFKLGPVQKVMGHLKLLLKVLVIKLGRSYDLIVGALFRPQNDILILDIQIYLDLVVKLNFKKSHCVCYIFGLFNVIFFQLIHPQDHRLKELSQIFFILFDHLFSEVVQDFNVETKFFMARLNFFGKLWALVWNFQLCDVLLRIGWLLLHKRLILGVFGFLILETL